jgi:uncharacterized protein HemY
MRISQILLISLFVSGIFAATWVDVKANYDAIEADKTNNAANGGETNKYTLENYHENS